MLKFNGDVVIYNGEELPAYPDKGKPAPAAPPELIVDTQRSRIDQLHQASSFSRDEFDALVMPAILRYASYVHLLPASESQHHCSQGGLFAHGLEVAFNAALACEGKVFAFDHWPSERDRLVPRWRMCALLGGIIHDMGKPVIDVGAVDQSGMLTWNPHSGPLYDWLVENELRHYYIHWRSGPRHRRHEAFNTVLLHKIIPEETIRWISRAGQEPMDALIMALSGTTNPNNPLCSIIKQADSKSVSADIQATRVRLAASGFGGSNSLAMRISRAIHDHIQTGAWPVNKTGFPIWFTTQGVFVLPEALQQVAQILRDKGDLSVPNDGREMITVLADWGYIHPNITAAGQQFDTWHIRISAIDRGKPITFDTRAVRFAKEDLIPRDLIPPDPVMVEIIGQNQKPVGQGGVITAPRVADPNAPAPAPAPLAAGPASSIPSPPSHPDKSAEAAGTSQRMEVQAQEAAKPVRKLVPDDSDESAYLAGAESLLGNTVEDGLLIASGMTDGVETPAPKDLLQMDDAGRNRDRAAEPDPRDELMMSARDQMSSRWPPESPKAAEAYFRGQGDEGAIVLALAARVGGVLQENVHMWDRDGMVHFKYPEAFEQLGIPEADIRTMLEAKQWTERDAAAPTRATVMLPIGSGRKAVTLRFTAHISMAIQLLLPARTGEALAMEAGRSSRVLPMGPYIDADIAGSIADRVTPAEVDSPLVRPCFHQFAIDTVEKDGRTLAELTAKEVHALVQSFTKSHGLTSGKWLSFHLLRGGKNPWAVKSESGQSSFIYNPAYRLDMDIAEQYSRGIS